MNVLSFRKVVTPELPAIEGEIGLEDSILRCLCSSIDRNAKHVWDVCRGKTDVLRELFSISTRRENKIGYSTAPSLFGPPSASRRSSYTRIGLSPSTADWKNSIPSSAGVFGVAGGWDDFVKSGLGIDKEGLFQALDMAGKGEDRDTED